MKNLLKPIKPKANQWVIYSEMENKQTIAKELEQIAPLLNQIEKKPVQSIPAGYFDQLTFQKPNLSSSVVKMPVSASSVIKRITSGKMYRWAAAAAVTALLVLGGLQLTDSSYQPLEKQVGMNYAELTSLNVSDWVQQLPNESIDAYLKSANALAGSENSLHHYTVDGVTKTTLNEISDEELQLYLKD